MPVRLSITALFVCLLHAQAAETMVTIPAGEFTMGRTRETSDDKTNMRPMILLDDRPAHKVFLDAFSIETHEVTNAQYEASSRRPATVPRITGSAARSPKARTTPYLQCGLARRERVLPVGRQAPADRSRMGESRARRTGSARLSAWGDKITLADARYNMSDGPGPVGKFKPNAFGYFDMAGNVSEWVNDWFDRTLLRNRVPLRIRPVRKPENTRWSGAAHGPTVPAG